MFKYFCATLLAIALIQGALAKPKAEEKTQFDDFAESAKKLVNNVTESLGLKNLDSQKVVDAVHAQATTLAKNVDEAVAKLKTELQSKQPEVEKVLKQIQKNLEDTSTNIQKSVGPDAAKKGKEIKETFEKGIKSAVDQVEKLYKAVEPDATKVKDDVRKAADTLLKQIVEVSENVQKQVKASMDEKH